MAAETKTDPAFLAEMILYLSRLAYTKGQVRGLTNAQWTALGFFGRVNQLSRTLTDFAKYHSTTQGSASQTVKNLVKKGLLTRTLSAHDKRSARYDLTEKGRNLCDRDPFEILTKAIAVQPEFHLDYLKVILKDILASIVADPQKQYFGTCSTCQFLKIDNDHDDAAMAYFCTRLKEGLSASDIHDICMNHQPKMSTIDHLEN